jgi:hypothetical protein
MEFQSLSCDHTNPHQVAIALENAAESILSILIGDSPTVDSTVPRQFVAASDETWKIIANRIMVPRFPILRLNANPIELSKFPLILRTARNSPIANMAQNIVSVKKRNGVGGLEAAKAISVHLTFSIRDSVSKDYSSYSSYSWIFMNNLNKI